MDEIIKKIKSRVGNLKSQFNNATPSERKLVINELEEFATALRNQSDSASATAFELRHQSGEVLLPRKFRELD